MNKGDVNGPQANKRAFSMEPEVGGRETKSENTSQNGVTTRNSSDALSFSDDKCRPNPVRSISDKGGKSIPLSNKSPERAKPPYQDNFDTTNTFNM